LNFTNIFVDVGIGVADFDKDAVTCTKGLWEIVGAIPKHLFVGVTLEVEGPKVLFCSEEEND